MKRFSRRTVTQMRKDRGWSMDDLARRARVTARTVLYLERGHAEPRARTLAGLAHAFGVPIDALFVEPQPKRQEKAA